MLQLKGVGHGSNLVFVWGQVKLKGLEPLLDFIELCTEVVFLSRSD